VSCPRSLPRTLALSLALVASVGACKDEPSNLEKLAADAGEPASANSGAAAASSAGPEGKTTVEPEPDGPLAPATEPAPPAPALPVDGDGLPIPALDGPAQLISAGADDRRVELRLALVDETRYRNTTIGMLKLPLFDSPVGFAREEQLELGDCEGEAGERSCTITHAYRNFEAEPPTGDALGKDEALVADLTTNHRLDASGLRASKTEVTGEITNPAAQALAQVHRLYCIRLPSEPVGIGATWRDTCRSRIGGRIVTREVVWRLAKLDDTDEGTRAELEYAGKVSRVDAGAGVRTGEVKGTLLLFVDAGEPHLLRERIAFILDPDRKVSTGTDLRVQFTKLGPKDELIRTDGKPFEASPTVLNQPRSAPAGDTRDSEK
jgi:hypothetical protein